MTVSNTNAKIIYYGNGSATVFTIPFPFISPSHLRLLVTDPEGREEVVSANYAFSDDLTSITYPTAESRLEPLQKGYKLTILRVTPLTQEMDLKSGHVLDAESLENGHDKVIFLIQELKEEIARCIRFAVSVTDEKTAEQFLNDITEATDTAKKSAQAAAGAASSATQMAETAAECGARAEDNATRAVTAAAAAVEAKNYIEARTHKLWIFTAGEASGSYDGSLSAIDTGTLLTDLTVQVYLNGQRLSSPANWTVNGTMVEFNFTLPANAEVIIEVCDLMRTAQETDVNEAISRHNSESSAHADLTARVAQLEKNGTGGSGSASPEKSVIASSGYWTADYINNNTVTQKFRTNIGVSGKTIKRVEVQLLNSETGLVLPLPILTGWGNYTGNFIDIYYQWVGANMPYEVTSAWFSNTTSINYVIRVFYTD